MKLNMIIHGRISLKLLDWSYSNHTVIWGQLQYTGRVNVHAMDIILCLLFVRPCLVRKKFQDSSSHRIFGRMHGALNIDENKN